MATKKPLIKIQCTACKRINYFARKSKKASENKIEVKKFCRWCRKNTLHKEGKR